MKKKYIIIVLILAIIMGILGFILLFNNKKISEESIVIIDATYSCASVKEDFYEDDKYIYSFPCIQSDSIFVKFSNGNKMLVVKALEEEKVTIDELINAGLNVLKRKK